MKRVAPAADRNKGPILEAIRGALPPRGVVLEIASGSGQHTVFFARNLPHLAFQPSDPDAAARASIAAYLAEEAVANARAPLALDVHADDWGIDACDAVVCINMIHIAPWSACEALFRGAARRLPSGAPLITYGPYRFDGAFTAESNAAFDADLRARDASWGVRDVADIDRVASAAGFAREATVALPANNHVLIYRRA